MKQSWLGIVLIGLGLLFLLQSLDVIPLRDIVRKFWPVVFILLGLAILLRGKKR